MITNFTTSKGLTIRPGDKFRDSRKSNIRTLLVDHLAEQLGVMRAHCIVVRQEYEGEVTEPMRPTVMEAERLGSRAFLPVPKDEQ